MNSESAKKTFYCIKQSLTCTHNPYLATFVNTRDGTPRVKYGDLHGVLYGDCVLLRFDTSDDAYIHIDENVELCGEEAIVCRARITGTVVEMDPIPRPKT